MSHPLFCLGKPEETALFEAIETRILQLCPDVTLKHDRTQTALVRKVQFAWLSLPRRKADAGALMLSIALPSRLESQRVLYAAEVAPGQWMHHLIIRSAEEMDADLCSLLQASWALVGTGRRGE